MVPPVETPPDNELTLPSSANVLVLTTLGSTISTGAIVPALTAVPPGVVTATSPAVKLAGLTHVTSVSETATTLVQATPFTFTADTAPLAPPPKNPAPVIVIDALSP